MGASPSTSTISSHISSHLTVAVYSNLLKMRGTMLLLVVAMAVLCLTDAQKKKKSDYAPGECKPGVKNCHYCVDGHPNHCLACHEGYTHVRNAIVKGKNFAMGGTGRKCGKCADENICPDERVDYPPTW